MRLAGLYLLSGAVLTLLLFGACQPAGVTPPPPPTQVALATTPPPTATPTTTATTSPTPTATATITPTPTITFTPTPLPTPEILDRYESPNGEWIALFEKQVATSETYNLYTFKVAHQDGTAEWLVEQEMRDKDEFMGFSSPRPLYWSADGQWLYFIHQGFGDGCGPHVNGHDLHRINLQTGKTTEVVNSGHDFDISPDESKVAYLSGETAIIKDLTTAEKIVIPIEYDPTIENVNFSDTTWASTGDGLLVLGKEDFCATGEINLPVFVVKIDVPTLTQTIVITDPSIRRIYSWPEPNQAFLYVQGEKTGTGILNVETGEIRLEEE